MGPEPRTRNHPVVVRTSYSSANFFFFVIWDLVALRGPFRHRKDLFFPSDRDTEGFRSCHQFLKTPADDIMPYSPITEVQGLVGVGVEPRVTCHRARK